MLYVRPTLLTAVGQTYKTRVDFRTKRFVNKNGIDVLYNIIILYSAGVRVLRLNVLPCTMDRGRGGGSSVQLYRNISKRGGAHYMDKTQTVNI